MQVLHSIWNMDMLYIWAESSERPLNATDESTRQYKQDKQDPNPHPFSIPGDELKKQLPDVFRGAGAKVERITLRLPSTKKGPQPSPWLFLEDCTARKAFALDDWTVEALAYEPGPAFDLLVDLPTDTPSGTVFGNSIRFWSDLAMLSLELIAREQFAPAVRADKALWEAVISDQDYERLETLLDSMPPSCLGYQPSDGKLPSSQYLVQSFINCTVDSFVRRSLHSEKLLPHQRGRKPNVLPLAQQFIRALTSDEAVLKASAHPIC